MATLISLIIILDWIKRFQVIETGSFQYFNGCMVLAVNDRADLADVGFSECCYDAGHEGCHDRSAGEAAVKVEFDEVGIVAEGVMFHGQFWGD